MKQFDIIYKQSLEIAIDVFLIGLAMDLFEETKRHMIESQPGVWEFTSPHVLYLSSEQGQAYTGTKDDAGYGAFHNETVGIVTTNAASILSIFNNAVTLIDLGPEYPDKTLPLMKQAKAENRLLDYCPVDINADYVKIAVDAAKPYAERTFGIKGLFQECATLIPAQTHSTRMAFIGLTFMNFESKKVLQMMQGIAGKNGAIAIACELITPENTIEKIVANYRNDLAREFAMGVMKNLKVTADILDFDVRFERNRVEVGFITKANIPHLGTKKGDRIITGFSHRYTREVLEKTLAAQGLNPHLWLSPSGKTAFALGI